MNRLPRPSLSAFLVYNRSHLVTTSHMTRDLLPLLIGCEQNDNQIKGANMVKHLVRAALVLAITIIATGELRAQNLANAQPVARFDTTNDADRAADLLRIADEHLVRLQWKHARRLYREAAELRSEAGQSPVVALRRVANAYYFENRIERAAAVLDEIAAAAADYGDVVAQGEAYADAALLYGQAGKASEFNESIDRLKKVLRSPYLPVEQRERLQSRLQSR